MYPPWRPAGTAVGWQHPSHPPVSLSRHLAAPVTLAQGQKKQTACVPPKELLQPKRDPPLTFSCFAQDGASSGKAPNAKSSEASPCGGPQRTTLHSLSRDKNPHVSPVYLDKNQAAALAFDFRNPRFLTNARPKECQECGRLSGGFTAAQRDHSLWGQGLHL